MIEMETDVADANADGLSLAYVTNARGRGVLKTTLKASAAGSTMLWENDMVNGYPALMSNQMPKNLVKGSSGAVCSSMLFGDFSQAIIALWTGVDILADPYTGGNEGATSIYAHQDFDFQVRYDEAFSKIVDMLTP
jgi:HK97 family phage major capsid protein